MPDYIDKFTGYRYYSMDKVAEMQRITELKDTGFSLEEIKRFCSAEEDKKYDFIWRKRQELEKLTEETAQRLRRLTEIEEKLSAEKKGENNMNKIEINSEFVNDERVIGRWEVVCTIDKKEDFSPGKSDIKNIFFEEIYFLPDGLQYWAFSWTKAYVKMSTTNDGKIFCRYEYEEINGEIYMFLEWSKFLSVFGKDEKRIVVLKQADNKHYNKYEIGRQDNIDLPFVNDENVLGKWVSVDYVKKIDDFNPMRKNWEEELFCKSLEFLPDGELICVMRDIFKQKWTKGTILFKSGDGSAAPAYEIRSIDGKEYLFTEWKSGDYTWGKRKPAYYVLVRNI